MMFAQDATKLVEAVDAPSDAAALDAEAVMPSPESDVEHALVSDVGMHCQIGDALRAIHPE